jgi:uncharacterized protein YbaP (TraB family)
MIRSLLLATTALLALAACDVRPQAEAVLDPAPVEAVAPPLSPMLFKVTDADSTLYLYGTIHLRKPGTDWGTEVVRAAIREATEVWTELEINPAKDVELAGIVGPLAASDVPLSQRLTPEQNARFAEVAGRFNLSPAGFEGYKPWFVGIQLSLIPMMQAGYNPAQGVDPAVDAFAEADGDTMRWFETAQEQLGFLAGLSDELQLQMLLDVLDEIDEGAEVIANLERAWTTGDEAAITGFMVDEMRTDYPELYEALIAGRNRRWVEVLKTEMAGAGVDFVAVGAGHLVGADAVQEGLRAAGYAVERVETRDPS